MSDAEFIMRTVKDGVVTDTPITREEMFGGNLMSQTMPDALTQALARIEALEAVAKQYGETLTEHLEAIDALEAQVRELQGPVRLVRIPEPFPKDNGDNAPPKPKPKPPWWTEPNL